MAPESIALVILMGLLGILAAAGLASAVRWRGALVRIRAVLGVTPGGDLEQAARQAVEARATADAERQRRNEDVSRLLDLLGVGVLRIGDDLVIRDANRAAHHFLGRTAGTLPGRTTIEAFGDHRVETVVLDAGTTGFASGETTIPGRQERAMTVRARRSVRGGTWVILQDVTEMRPPQ